MVKDFKQKIIDNFKIMIYKVYSDNDKAAVFKAREYSKAIKALSDYHGPIDSLETAKNILIKSGKKNPVKILKKIKEIVDTGKLEAAEKVKKDPRLKALTNLTKVYSIGDKKALQLYEKLGITTVPQLKKEFKKDPSILHNKQQIGLKYFADLQKRIPRKEMLDYETLLKQVDPSLKLSINGSFRRGAKTSGDIDVLINGTQKNRNDFIKVLKESGLMVETLANGKKKFMGIIKLPNYKTYRHIDIIDSDDKSFPFGVLYFTGSAKFNTEMRNIALAQGYSLNEYDFTHKGTKKSLTKREIFEKIGKEQFENEKDIFKFLNMKYVKPQERDF